MVGAEESLDVGLKGVFFGGVLRDGWEEDFGGVFEVVNEGTGGPPGRVAVAVSGKTVGVVGAWAVLITSALEEVMLFAPVSACFVGSAYYGGFGNERSGGEWAHANLAAGVGGVVWEGVMGDMENGLNGLLLEARESFRGEAELWNVGEASESMSVVEGDANRRRETGSGN